SMAKVAQMEREVDAMGASPWRLRLELMMERTEGHWLISSGSATIRTSPLHTILTAGLLEPRVLRVPLHIVGMWCRNARRLNSGYAIIDAEDEEDEEAEAEEAADDNTNVDPFVIARQSLANA